MIVPIIPISNIKHVVEDDPRDVQLTSPQALRTSEFTECTGQDLQGNVRYLRTNFCKNHQGNVYEPLGSELDQIITNAIKIIKTS